jgi:hypothetical protein
MPSLSEIAWTIAGCAGVGAFIDFYIGKRGQRCVRDWLETWWLRFSYVTGRNFGREEARFAVTVMDRVLGRRFFSLRRLFAVAVAAVVALVPPAAAAIIQARWDHFEIAWLPPNPSLIMFAVSLVFFSLALAITRGIAVKSVNILDIAPRCNAVILLGALIAQLLLLVLWIPLRQTLFFLAGVYYVGVEGAFEVDQSIFTRAVSNVNLSDILTSFSPDEVPFLHMIIPNYDASNHVMGIVPSIGRLALAAIFLGSYLLKPLHGTISTLWLRVVESEQPIFTLLFSGAAVAARGIEAIIQALH